jgi:hypothetical protein
MNRTARWLGAAVLAALAAACGEGGRAKDGLGPMAPRLVGTTATVTVNCPAKLEKSTSASCSAYGYDANGVFTNSSVTAWSTSNSSLATISGSGVLTAGTTTGTVTVYATIDGITGSTTVQIVPPLAVTISGYSPVHTNSECYYYANPSYGVAPYTYTWSQSYGSGYSDGDVGYYATSSSSYALTVTVHDAAGHTASATKYVTVSSTAPYCAV